MILANSVPSTKQLSEAPVVTVQWFVCLSVTITTSQGNGYGTRSIVITISLSILSLFQTTHYRFSLSWARIFTDGTASTFNQAGIDFYNKFIDALVAAGIQPVVTLYHWDLPQHLQDIGGWPNEELVGHFENYARTCYNAFADRVFLNLVLTGFIILPIWISFL